MVMTIMLQFRLSMTLLTTLTMMLFLLVYLYAFAFLSNLMIPSPVLRPPRQSRSAGLDESSRSLGEG